MDKQHNFHGKHKESGKGMMKELVKRSSSEYNSGDSSITSCHSVKGSDYTASKFFRAFLCMQDMVFYSRNMWPFYAGLVLPLLMLI